MKQLSMTLAAVSFLAAGCAAEPVAETANTKTAAGENCSGSEWVDDSSIAVLPIPIVAFFVPHADLNDVQGEDYVKKKCGDSKRLVKRDVDVNRVACIPAGLTRLVTLGVWQWCPARVSWEVEGE